MKSIAKTVGGCAAGLVLAAALIITACSSESAKYVGSSKGAARPAAAQGRGSSPGGFRTFGEGDTVDYAAVPSISLQDALASGQGGGGLSPFRAGVPVTGDSAVGFDPVLDGFMDSRWSETEITTGNPNGVGRERRPSVRTCANEEIWVIERRHADSSTRNSDATDCGALICRQPGADPSIQPVDVPVPLEHTDVQASIAGYIATVDVKQRFHNPYSSKIEAVYVFPLPENAAVNSFLMTVGDRTIRGIIREKEEAQRIYTEARSQGYVASLMTQDRPNVFTQSVANIEPGKSIDIDIAYFHTIPYRDGAYEFVFPMVVGPRFNPPGATDGIGAVARGDHGASGQTTEVQYLAPEERSGHDISVAVDLDAGVELEDVQCRSHAVSVKRESANRARVKLSEMDSVPNKDFVLRYAVAGSEVKSGILAGADERGGYFTLMLVPPAGLENLERSPVEMVFVLDCSGSMSGRPLEQAKAAAARGLSRLQPGDSFQIINFSNSSSQLGSYTLDANAKNVGRGKAYLDALNSEGGTMMMEGIRAALNFPHDPERPRYVAFLTDGYIGNEAEILGEMHKRLKGSRVFSFGVGSSVNRFLMDSMAKLGRGAAAYVAAGDSSTEVMDLYFDRISHPALTDLSIDWGNAEVTDVYPRELPDLFVGRPVIVTGRFSGRWDGPVRVSGRAGGRPVEVRVSAPETTSGAATALAPIWARMKIADLSARACWEPGEEIGPQVRRTALDYALMSEYTSFVAVDSLSRTAGNYGTTVAVPVALPEGVKYQTTVEDDSGPRR